MKHQGQVGWCPTLSADAQREPLHPNFGHETPRMQAAYRAASSAQAQPASSMALRDNQHGQTSAQLSSHWLARTGAVERRIARAHGLAA